MEFFNKPRVVKLRSHLDKYLVAGDDQETVRQSRNGSSVKARWLVEPVESDGGGLAVRFTSCHGRYLTATYASFLLGMTGNKVLQTVPGNTKDFSVDWYPIREGFQVKLRAFGGTYLRANGGTPPWRNSVTHDSPYTKSTNEWVLWDVEAVESPEKESMKSYLSTISSFSSVSDEFSGVEVGSPVSIQSTNSPMMSIKKSSETGMDLFRNAKAVRLRSHHRKYLHADEDEDSVTQSKSGSSKNAVWEVEFVDNIPDDNIIRLKSRNGKYLTASNQPFLLGMTGRKVLQTLPRRLDSSVEWEPVKEGSRVKLRTRYGQFLRGNGGLPPWRNSVTHDVPHRTSTQDWILWDVDVVEIVARSTTPKPAPQLIPRSDSLASDGSSSPSTHSTMSPSFSREESFETIVNSPPRRGDGRIIYYHLTDAFGDVDDDYVEGLYITFEGNEVNELTRRLEEETGLENIIVCTKNPLNGKLCQLRLNLPPNHVPMNVVLLQSSSKVAGDFAETRMPI